MKDFKIGDKIVVELEILSITQDKNGTTFMCYNPKNPFFTYNRIEIRWEEPNDK